MAHYYSETQDCEPKVHRVKINILDHEFEIYSASGVFAAKKMDKGTEILLKNFIMKPKWSVLDLGCGCGIVGVTVAEEFPKAKVLMSDINKRAIRLAMINSENRGLSHAKVIHSDKFEGISEKFNTILLNPPQKAGKQVCFDMIEQSKTHLKKGGLLQIVARHNKGGKVLSGKMKDVFGNVRDIAKKSGYRVYVSEN